MTTTTMEDQPGGWCYQHEQFHAPMDWRDGCQDAGDIKFEHDYLLFRGAWADTDRQDRRRRGWWKRLLVCWWLHRTRRAAAGVYVSRSCRACTPGVRDG